MAGRGRTEWPPGLFGRLFARGAIMTRKEKQTQQEVLWGATAELTNEIDLRRDRLVGRCAELAKRLQQVALSLTNRPDDKHAVSNLGEVGMAGNDIDRLCG